MDGKLGQCYIRFGRVLGCGLYRPSTPPSPIRILAGVFIHNDLGLQPLQSYDFV